MTFVASKVKYQWFYFSVRDSPTFEMWCDQEAEFQAAVVSGPTVVRWNLPRPFKPCSKAFRASLDFSLSTSRRPGRNVEMFQLLSTSALRTLRATQRLEVNTKHFVFTVPLQNMPQSVFQYKKQDEAHEPECRHVCEEQRQYLCLTFSSEPTCENPWVDTLRWHSCRTPLLDTIAQHSGKTLLVDTSYLTLLQQLLTWHSCKTPLLDTLVRHSYLTFFTWHFLLDTLVRHSYLTLLLDTLTWHSCKTLLLDTLVRHASLTLLLGTSY